MFYWLHQRVRMWIHWRNSRRCALFSILLVYSLAMCGTAAARVDSIELTDSGPLGVYGDRNYVWARVKISGTIFRSDQSVGKYRVPGLLMFPETGAPEFGFVDVVNASVFAIYTDETAPKRKRSVTYAGSNLYGDMLLNLGASYIGVMAYKVATEALGTEYGTIDRGTDGYQIIMDAAEVLRSPVSLPNTDIAAVDRVIGLGLSASAGTLRYMMQQGMNGKSDGELVFDGIIAAVNNACFPLVDDAVLPPAIFPQAPWYYRVEPCTDQIPDHGKFITVLSETDYIYHEPTRPAARNYRQYELAGVSHIPTDMRGLTAMGVSNQNPVSYKPVFRSVLGNMLAWLDGTPPPPSKFLDVAKSSASMQIARDADGNATGGLRLPHMPGLDSRGNPIGAPLGVYAGVNERYRNPRNVFPLLGGTFTPFPVEKLRNLYPTRDVYIERVKAVADSLLRDRYILAIDHRRYLKAAQYQPLDFLAR